MENSTEFMIHLGSVRDVEDFVRLATSEPFPVYLDDGQHRVNGKSFMEMFCLVLTRPLNVTADCTEAQLQEFRAKCANLLAN